MTKIIELSLLNIEWTCSAGKGTQEAKDDIDAMVKDLSRWLKNSFDETTPLSSGPGDAAWASSDQEVIIVNTKYIPKKHWNF